MSRPPEDRAPGHKSGEGPALLATGLVTYLPLPLSLLILEGEEVQIGHLQLCLAGFQEAAYVPIDTGARRGIDNVGRERRAVPEFL